MAKTLNNIKPGDAVWLVCFFHSAKEIRICLYFRGINPPDYNEMIYCKYGHVVGIPFTKVTDKSVFSNDNGYFIGCNMASLLNYINKISLKGTLFSDYIKFFHDYSISFYVGDDRLVKWFTKLSYYQLEKLFKIRNETDWFLIKNIFTQTNKS